jgi:hypothetical protein
MRPSNATYAAELAELMADGEWWTVNALRKPKVRGWHWRRARQLLRLRSADERFDSVSGDQDRTPSRRDYSTN